MTIVVIAQVICRTFLGFSLFWAEELARFCLIWITFLGASIALRNADLAALDLIQKKIHGRWQWVCQLVIQILILIFILISFYYGVKQAMSPSIMGQVSPAMRLPMVIVYSSVPVGFGFMFIHTIESLIKVVINRREKKACQSSS